MAKVGIIMGSKSDLPIMEEAASFLKEFGIEIGGHVTRIGSIGYTNYADIRFHSDSFVQFLLALVLFYFYFYSRDTC